MRSMQKLGSALLAVSLAACASEGGTLPQPEQVTVRLNVDGTDKVRTGQVGAVMDAYIDKTPWTLFHAVEDRLEPLGSWNPSEIWAHESTSLFTMGGGELPEGLRVDIRSEEPYRRATAQVGDYQVHYVVDGSRLTATARGSVLWTLSVEGEVSRDRLQDYFASAIANTARGSSIHDLVAATQWNYGNGAAACLEEGQCARGPKWEACKKIFQSTWKWLVGGGAATVSGVAINEAKKILNNYNECNAEVAKCKNNQEGCLCSKTDCDSLCGDKGEKCAGSWSKASPSCTTTPPGGGPPTGKVYFMCNYSCEKQVACSDLCSPESIVYSPCGCPKQHLNASCSGTDVNGTPISTICLASNTVDNWDCES